MRLLGRFNHDMDVVKASDFGRRLGFLHEPFIIGSDARYGSLPLKLALTSGLISAGCNVADLGFVPAPVVAKMAREERVWGLHVSADPYPSEYVGVRIYDSLGMPWNGKLQPNGRGGAGRLSDLDIVPSYMGELASRFELEPLKIVIDSANGPSGSLVSSLLRSMGFDVTELNTSLSPYPSRGYEPCEKNIKDLEYLVRRKRADLGVAFDGSGLKASFVTSKGFISTGRAMALLMKFGEYDRAIADIGSTHVLDVVGTVERVVASESKVSEQLYNKGFEIGGGTMGVIFPEWSYSSDGIYLMMEVLRLVSSFGSLQDLNSQLVDSYELVDMVKVENVSEAIDSAKLNLYDADLDLREGVKAVWEDGWLWIKPMNGFVRIFSEADSRKRARELIELGKNAIKG